MFIRTAIAALTLFALLPLASALADSAERATYKAAVEPICKANKEASQRILTGVERMVRHDQLQQAAKRFTRAAAALEKAEKQLAGVPAPPEDVAKLGKWLAGIKGEVSLMTTIATKFKAGDKSKGSSLAVKLTHNATVANNLVIAFQFNYCRIDPSQYT